MPEDIEREQGFVERAGAVVAAIFGRGYLGGELKAAFLQGANELGAFFSKPLPDSIQVDTPGTAFNPLYRDRDGDTPAHADAVAPTVASPLPSPAEIAQESRGSVYGPDQPAQANALSPSEIARESQGSVHGPAQQENTASLPSPSEIANEQPSPAPEQEHGHEHDRGRDGR